MLYVRLILLFNNILIQTRINRILSIFLLYLIKTLSIIKKIAYIAFCEAFFLFNLLFDALFCFHFMKFVLAYHLPTILSLFVSRGTIINFFIWLAT